MKNLRKTIQCSSRSNEKNIYIFENCYSSWRVMSLVFTFTIQKLKNELIKKLNLIFYNKN